MRGWNGDGLQIYLSGFSVPVICGSANGKKVKFVKSNYPFLKSLKLADEGLHKESTDFLNVPDFYWNIADGLVKRGNDVVPVALWSKLRLSLNGPMTKHNLSSLANHVENNVLHIKTTNLEERKIDNF